MVSFISPTSMLTGPTRCGDILALKIQIIFYNPVEYFMLAILRHKLIKQIGLRVLFKI